MIRKRIRNRLEEEKKHDDASMRTTNCDGSRMWMKKKINERISANGNLTVYPLIGKMNIFYIFIDCVIHGIGLVHR